MKALSIILVPTFAIAVAHAQEPACRTGAASLGDAYVLANPLYSIFFEETLDHYVTENRTHFVAGGDAIRCASALAQALLVAGVQLYDPNEQTRRDELNAQLQSMGVSQGQQELSPSSQLFDVGSQLSRLSRVLPAAADGDWVPYQTPANEIEQLRMFAGTVLRTALSQDPQLVATITPKIRELALLDRGALVRVAAQMAGDQ